MKNARAVRGGLDGRITLAPGADRVGLAVMLADLIRQNLQSTPRKGADFERLRAAIALEVPDAEVAVTLEFRDGRLLIHGAIKEPVQLHVTAGATALLELPLVKITAGLPNLLHGDGRALRRGLLGGAISIRGMVRHPLSLLRFTRLISVGR